MAMKYAEKNVKGVTSEQVLMFPDHYVAFSHKLSKNSALAVTEGNRKIVKAGTIFPANDDTAVGVVLNDYDVTDGDASAAIAIHGFFGTRKLPVAPTAEAERALKMIQFFPLKKTELEIERTSGLVVAGTAGTIVLKVNGTRFKAIPGEDEYEFEAGTTGISLDSSTPFVLSDDKRELTINVTGTSFAAGTATIALDAAVFANGKAGETINIYV